LLQGRMDEARKIVLEYQGYFDEFYLEIQRHPIPELDMINQGLVTLSRETGIPLVATNDVHYIYREDAAAQDLMVCIQTNSTINDDKRHKMTGDGFYLKSEEEMLELFADMPEAVTNTSLIADSCSLELDFTRLHLPEIDLPEGKTSFEYLAELCDAGLKRQYREITPEIEQRLSYELDVIRQTEFANYFLVVWDIMSNTRSKGIMCAVRGSAAASIVLYCLGITEIDPLKYNLVFERFLNVERKEMPDIDLDFQDDRRDEVLEYVTEKYGKDHVAHIITFGTMGARAALRDVGRALGMAYGDVDRIAKLIPTALNITLEQALVQNAELRNAYMTEEPVKRLVDSARKLEGISRHASTHAAGVVISKEPLTQYVPLQRASKDNGQTMAMTQFSMDTIAKIGLLKLDFLGLANLTILDRAKTIIYKTHNEQLNLSTLPLDDAKTYELLSRGDTNGIFQLESNGMKKYIRELKPSNFNDIAAMIALYRPGPMENIPHFINSKQGKEPVHYPHPALEDILKETYGVIVYQEQVLYIVRTFAGYSLGKADIIRKAMGKKIAEVMKKEKSNFINGAVEKGFSKNLAQEIFTLIEPFAGYAFNKAHSVSYAMIAYQTAFLKANYPVEYMTALLSTNMRVSEKVISAISECARLGIKVLPPDINKSYADFVIEETPSDGLAVRFGLGAIKNVGGSALEPIISARNEGGEFTSLEDFCRRASLGSINKKVMESLIKVGAFDSIVGNRGGLLEGIEKIISLAQKEQRLRETGQSTMFDLFGHNSPTPLPAIEIPPIEISLKDKLAWEKELAGVYLSEHPMYSAAKNLANRKNALCGQIDVEMEGERVEVAGMISLIQDRVTRENKPFISASLEDLEGSIEVTAWPEVYRSTRGLWEVGNIVFVGGKVKVRDERVNIICDTVRLYQPSVVEEKGEAGPPDFRENTVSGIPGADGKEGEPPSETKLDRSGRKLLITLNQEDSESGNKDLMDNIFRLLKDNPGKDEVTLAVVYQDQVINMEFPGLLTSCNGELKLALSQLGVKVGIV
ncbi:MAG: DNA polymerase III subunit alpha, partial [Dehalococcoidia bacterium]|nr:DNA polymerase III subunit alpha [Dehalococcoidia bacterium]